MLTSAKIAGKRLFDAFGLDIRKSQPSLARRSSLPGPLSQLSHWGCAPRTVIDVGVAYQARELYEAFPASKFLLIDPLAELERSLQKICATYNPEYVLAAAGVQAGTVTLHVQAPLTQPVIRALRNP